MAEYSPEEKAAAAGAGENWLEADPELLLMGQFIDDHGAPDEWTEAVARQYEDEHNRLTGEGR
ncbi:hypothetical protein ACFC1T_27720 [Kitasatospora sp. NPDC056076]|uniref:hypothetical protein n=1 Tax=Kitasatospora sp. NPDC056076 TaxID=3345703 RepID=UPI0035D8CCE4